MSEYQKKEERTKEHAENCDCPPDKVATSQESGDGGQKSNSSPSLANIDNNNDNEEKTGNSAEKFCSPGFESPTFNFSNSPDSIFDLSSDSESEPN